VTQREERSAEAGPQLVLVDSVLLVESDTLFLGQPLSITTDPSDGTIYVADAMAGRIVRYARDGRPLRLYGKAGPGPGELELPMAVFVAGDALAVVDGMRNEVLQFDRATGSYRGLVHLGGWTGNVVSSAYDTVWMGVRNPVANTIVAAWDVGAERVLHMGPIPEEFRTFPNITRAQGLGVVRWGDTLLVGFGPLNGLLVMATDGSVLDTVSLPVTHRRGVPAKVLETDDGTLAYVANRVSAGDAAVVHYDLTVDGQPRPRIGATMYLSVLSRDRYGACVDKVVPVRGASLPAFTFRADTLLVVFQQVTDTVSAAWLKAFVVSQERCEWHPIVSKAMLN
jgi:hypothetical protein